MTPREVRLKFIAAACLLVFSAGLAHAGPSYDDQRGSATDLFRDLLGVDNGANLTTGVAIDTAATVMRLSTANTIGTFLTQPYAPLAGKAWQKVFVRFTAAAPDDLTLAAYSASGDYLADLPLVATAQAGFTREADLSGIDFTAHPGLRFLVTLDGVGATFAPVVDNLMVTWQPLSTITAIAVPRGAACSGSTITFDVPVSVSNVRAQQLVVKLAKPASENAPRGASDLVFVSATQGGQVAASSLTFDALQVAAGDVYWVLPATVEAGSTFILSVTFNVPRGTDDAVRYRTTVSADALNADLAISASVAAVVTAAPAPTIYIAFEGSPLIDGVNRARAGTNVTTRVHIANAPGSCRQVYHDAVVVADLEDFAVDGESALATAPTAISDGGEFLAPGVMKAYFGQQVTGPAVVWTMASLAPEQEVSRSFVATLAAATPNGPLSLDDRLTVDASVSSTWDQESAATSLPLVVGFDWKPDGAYGLGNSYLGLSRVTGANNDLPTITVADGVPFGFPMRADNRGLSELRDVVMFFQIPAGLNLSNVAARAGQTVSYRDARGGDPSNAPPDYDAALGLGLTWQSTPPGGVRWVAIVVARLASNYYPQAGLSATALADIEVSEAAPGAACVLRTYTGQAWFHARRYVDGDTGAVNDNPSSVPVADIDPISVNSIVPRPAVRVSASPGQRVGAGPVTYTFNVDNGTRDGNTVDVARDALLTIQVPTVDIAGTRQPMPLMAVEGGDAAVDLSALAAHRIQLRWPTLAPESTREVRVTLAWPPGGFDADVANLVATLTADDDFCGSLSAAAAVSTELDVRPALLVTKAADLESAQPGSLVTYTIRATNVGDGAGQDTVLFDRVPPGLNLHHVVAPTNGGRVFVSNVEPPHLPTSFSDLTLFSASLLSSDFVVATALPDGTWVSPFGADTTWVAVELDDPSLSPPRMLAADELTTTLTFVVDELAPDALIINRAAIDADQVLAAVSRPVRTTITKVPAAKIVRSGPDIVSADETFEYQVATWNASSELATTLTLSETLPVGVTLISASFAWNDASMDHSGVTVLPVIAPDGSITFDLSGAVGGPLGSLQGGTVTFSVHVDASAPSNQFIDFETNVAVANADLPTGIVVGATSAVRVSNADLHAAINVDRRDPIAGDTVSVTLLVANDDLHLAADTTVSLRIPAALTPIGNPIVLAPSFAFAGEPILSEVRVGNVLVAHDLTWAGDRALGPIGGPAGRVRGQSGPIGIALRLHLADGTPVATELPLTLTLTTSTGQGANVQPDIATVTLRTPDADPGLELVVPAFALPEDTLTSVVRYGDYTRQVAGPATIIVSLPHSGATLTSTYVGHVATRGESIWLHAGPIDLVPSFDPSDPASGGWKASADELAGPVAFMAIYATSLPPQDLRSVYLKTTFASPESGALALGGTRHDVCAQITAPTSGNDDTTNDQACATVAIPGVNLAASLTGTPAGAAPGVAVGETVDNTLTVTNAGTVASFGNHFTFAPGLLVPEAINPGQALITNATGGTTLAVSPDGSAWSGPIPISLVDGVFYLGSHDANDPLYYRNVGLRAGDAVSVHVTSAAPTTLTNGTRLIATLTVANDGLVDPGPSPVDPEDMSDNVATFEVSAWRPDLFVQLAASDLIGATSPVTPGESIRWTTTYNNLGGIEATDATFTSTIPDGTHYVIDSLADVPPGFTPDFLGPTGWGYAPLGAPGDEDPAVRAIRMGGAALEAPVNPYYRATMTALAAGTHQQATLFGDGKVSATTRDGDVWRSEPIGVGVDIQQWTRVQLEGRGGDNPLYVRVLDPNTHSILPGFEQVAVDASGTVDLSAISASAYPSLQFEVVFGGQSPRCDVGSGWTVRIESNDGFVDARFSQGKVAGGQAQIAGTDYDSTPALFVPNGQGPDGWGVELLPKPPNVSQAMVVAMNEDGTLVLAEGSDTQGNYRIIAYKKTGTSWLMSDLWDQGFRPGGISRPYNGSYNSSASGLYVLAYGSPRSFIYFDQASPTGVRVLGPQEVGGDAAVSQSVQGFSLQPVGGPPLLVTNGDKQVIVHAFDNGVQTGTKLPLPDGFSACTGQDIVDSRPAIVGYCYDATNTGYATFWSQQVDGWHVEVIGDANTYAYLAANDGSIYTYRQNGYGFYQKRAGVWTFFPFEMGGRDGWTGNVGWTNNRDSVRDNTLFNTVSANGRTTLLIWRTPRPDEDVAPLVEVSTLEGDRWINSVDFYGAGTFRVELTNSANQRVPAFIQRQPDGSWKTSIVGVPAQSPRFSSFGYNYGANYAGAPFEDTVEERQIAFLRDGVPALANVYPSDYPASNYKSEVTPIPGAEIMPYGTWRQGLLYGCKMASDASFTGFAVKYRAATSPSYSFVTRVDTDTCQSQIVGQSKLDSARLDVDPANNQASASIGLAIADLEVALTTPNSVAQVGGPIAWAATITNHGPNPVTDAWLHFTPAGASAIAIPLGPLAVGEQRSLPFSGGTVPDAPDGTLLNAVAAVSSELADCNAADDVATAGTLVANQPNAWVTLDVPATTYVGQVFKAKVRYGNDTAFTLAPGAITVTMPAWISLASGSAVSPFDALAPGAAGAYDVELVATACAQVGATAQVRAQLASANDYLALDNEALDTTTLADSGRLGVDLIADRATVPLGESVTWVARFANTGARAANATLTVTLPSDAIATFTAAGTTPGYVRNGDTLTWSIGELGPNIAGSVMFTATRIAAGSLTATAAITSPYDCPNVGADTASVALALPGVHVATAIDATSAALGDTVEWSVVVSNDGPTALANMTLSDLIPAGLSYVAGSIHGPGANATASPTLGWAIGAIPPGQAYRLGFATTVTGAATDLASKAVNEIGRQAAGAIWTGTPPTSATSDTSALFGEGDGMPQLQLAWSEAALTPGATMTVPLSYTNPAAPLTGVSLTTALGDHLELVAAPGATVLDGRVSWAIGALAAGATGSVTMTVRAADMDSGTIVFGRAALVAVGVPPQTSNDVLAMYVDCNDDNLCTLDAYTFNVGCSADNNAAYTRATSCGRGVCAAQGAETCANGAFVNSCTPGQPASATETCNLLDDNCDGTTDENIAAIPTTCGKSICAATGASTCQGGQMVDSCTPKAATAETCDSVDNDCNDLVDDGLLSIETACGVGVCAGNVGIDHCVGGVQVNTCDPLARAGLEVCNALDDNCDGLIDLVGGVSVCPALDTIIVTGPDVLTARPLATFTFDLANNVAHLGFECRLDGGAWTHCDSGSASYTVSPGMHTFVVRGIGMNGAVDPTPAAATWTYDPSAPDTFIDLGPADPSQSGDAHFELSSTNLDDALFCALDVPTPRPENYTPCDNSTDFAGLADGEHRLSVYAVNALGVADATPATWTWTIDSTLPETTITSGPSGTSNIDDAAFTFTSPDPDATFECRIDGGAFAPCAPGVSYPVAEGPHTFEVRAVDLAGNVDPTPATRDFVVDRSAPVVTIVTGPDDPTASRDADFTLSANESPVTYLCALATTNEPAPADYSECSDAPSYAEIADGEHVLWAIAKDTAGNVSAPDQWPWTVDARVLETEITAGPVPITTLTAGADFAYRDPSAGLTTFDCKLDGEAWRACDGGTLSVAASALAVGPHRFEVRTCARDLTLVCDETPAVWQWEVSASPCPLDVTAPTIACASDIALECGDVPELTMATATDDCGATVRLIDAPASYPLGTTPLVYVAVDGNGNEASCSVAVVVADRLAPSLTCPASITVPSPPDRCGADVTWEAPTVADACGLSTFVLTNDAPAVAAIGTTTVTWTATDSSGNAASCATSVVVEDQTAPVITCGTGTSTITASIEDACGATPTIEDIGCTWIDIAGIEHSLAECPVTADAASVTIGNSFAATGGQVAIRWVVVATDAAGNDTRATCTTAVDLDTPPLNPDDFAASGGGGCTGASAGTWLALGLAALFLGRRRRA